MCSKQFDVQQGNNFTKTIQVNNNNNKNAHSHCDKNTLVRKTINSSSSSGNNNAASLEGSSVVSPKLSAASANIYADLTYDLSGTGLRDTQQQVNQSHSAQVAISTQQSIFEQSNGSQIQQMSTTTLTRSLVSKSAYKRLSLPITDTMTNYIHQGSKNMNREHAAQMHDTLQRQLQRKQELERLQEKQEQLKVNQTYENHPQTLESAVNLPPYSPMNNLSGAVAPDLSKKESSKIKQHGGTISSLSLQASVEISNMPNLPGGKNGDAVLHKDEDHDSAVSSCNSSNSNYSVDDVNVSPVPR